MVSKLFNATAAYIHTTENNATTAEERFSYAKNILLFFVRCMYVCMYTYIKVSEVPSPLKHVKFA